MSNILITGANGQIGSELRELVERGAWKHHQTQCHFADRETLDITDKSAIEDFVVKNNIDIIINAAAYTAVEKAESEPDLAYVVNHLAVKSLAEISKKHAVELIHISTDYIFDGKQHTPYREDDTPNPQGVYSRSKWLGEEEIKKIAPSSALIIRTSWVYSKYGHNFVKTMLQLSKEQSSVGVVYDQLGTPTYGKDIAKAILHIIDYRAEHPESKKSLVETYHYSNEGACSWYDYAQAIFDLTKSQCSVKPIDTQSYPTATKRPPYSLLNKEKIKRDFGIEIPFWRDRLKSYLQEEERQLPRISVIGSGFIAKGLINLLRTHFDYKLSYILTRTDITQREDFPLIEYLTNDLEDLIQNSDLIVECSGDALYATETISEILKAKIPVVTMNSEFHITTGSYFVNKGIVTEAEGDRPGVLAILHEEAVAMGFKPVLYANIKGFLNHNPTREDMEYWGGRSNLSLDMVTSFTDGTKVQIEQVLVANGFKTDIIQEGLVRLENDDMLEGGTILAEKAKAKGLGAVSDYLLSSKLPAGVFLLAEHDKVQEAALKYYKLGDGPYYVLERTYHICHLEIVKTINRVLSGGGVLLDNGTDPKYSVAAIAKRDLKAGETIKKGIGSFSVRGSSVEIDRHPTHVPIGLMVNVTLKRDIKAGDIVEFDDVEIEQSLALDIWREMIASR